jgi:hypothetical protein
MVERDDWAAFPINGQRLNSMTERQPPGLLLLWLVVVFNVSIH